MSNETTLFAHIAPRLTDRIEDVAVEALGHILSNSEAARRALEETVQLGMANIGSIDRVQTQVTDEKGGRPDLVAFDDKGVKRVLIEAKFWAGLTPNQPNRYLEQLPGDEPGALLFIAPAARLAMLWPKLCQRAKGRFVVNITSGSGDLRAAVLDDGERYLLLTSWAALLDRMEERTNKAEDTASKADILQLLGLTKRMDADAFLPWRSEDLGPEFARRMLGLITLVDDATNSGIAENFLDTSKLKTAPRYEGYGRNIRIGGVVAWFGFILDGWAQHGDTPLWLLFSYDEYEQLQEAGLADAKVVKWRTKDGKYCIPIALPAEVDYDEVLDSVVTSLEEIAGQLTDSDG